MLLAVCDFWAIYLHETLRSAEEAVRQLEPGLDLRCQEIALLLERFQRVALCCVVRGFGLAVLMDMPLQETRTRTLQNKQIEGLSDSIESLRHFTARRLGKIVTTRLRQKRGFPTF